MLLPALDAQLRGCDVLDPAHCLLPFPNDHFTVAASAGSPQSLAAGGTGRRINFSPLAMPRNVAGKPIDPTEWNRNDGYSPGQMILTFVPELAANADGTIPGVSSIRDTRPSLNLADSPVLVIDAESGEPHPVWAEIDLNAGTLLFVPGREVGAEDDAVIANPKPKQAALIIRPAANFKEGRRYVVVLRNLPKPGGGTVAAGPAFAACRDRLESALPPLQQRCAALEASVFPPLAGAGVARDASLYLAWDFTVTSTNAVIGRLRHMRDDAFVNYLGQLENADGEILNLGRAPKFEITEVNEFPPDHGQLVREIKGTFTVPSYVVPVDPSPLDGQAELRRRINELPPEIQEQLEDGPVFAPIELSLPPNRLFYLPDETSATACDPAQPEASLLGRCVEQARFGDGLPDRTGEMTTTFTCRIAKSTLSNKRFADATAADVIPARPSLYGHGLLGSHEEINQDQLRNFGNDHNMMFCATDWFGFASGDLPNVLTLTLDLSNFPVLPDGTQQGILNQMFLARLMRHPQGFAANENFQVAGQPVFDRREVFYDGNSQGGITGGVVVAVSKDIRRGSLGVLGMNYSTLLTRSVDFDIFSVPLYLSYPDDLERSLNFSLMQMLWDRSENNGYAHHLRDNRALKGAEKEVLLHPAFGDHQVTMWSADVMARTVGASVDRSRVAAERREPVGFNNPELPGFEVTDYLNPAHAAGSGLMYWDEPWPDDPWQDCAGMNNPVPPVGNVPPRAGDDPHECPRRQAAARCQKSHFLHTQGRLIDVSGVSGPADCPAEPAAVGPLLPGSGAQAFDLCDPITGQLCLSQVPVVGPLLLELLEGGGAGLEAIPAEVIASTVRTVCDYQWLTGVCDQFAHDDPGYLALSDPSPANDYFLAVGAVHEHSGYSDGDPAMIPRDYFAAATSGHNVSDDGLRDTGVKLDFMLSSEHSENEKLPITTSAACLPFSQDFASDPGALAEADPTAFVTMLACSHLEDPDHYFKWRAALQQAGETSTPEFTAVRGFEWTNDFFNHMNVYFSTNVVNAKIDGSYVSMAFFWDWLREPVDQGGGADALVTFNHPGGNPKLSPFDGGLPHTDVLAATGGANWNDLAYVPEVDERVVGIEVNGGDDIEWYVKALTKGWHVGPVAAEDEHQREWATTQDGKTLMLTRGRSPRDYYWAMKNRRTVAIRRELVAGAPGSKAQFPQILFWADGASVQTGAPLGSRITTPGPHTLHVDIQGLPGGAKVSLLTRAGQNAPIPLADDNIAAGFSATHLLQPPATGEDWYFVVVCPAGAALCGSDRNHLAVTAPIWFGPGGAPPTGISGYGSGLLGLIGELGADLQPAISALLDGDMAAAGAALQTALGDALENLAALPESNANTGELLGEHADPAAVLLQATSAQRAVEPVVLTGAQVLSWSQPAAIGLPLDHLQAQGVRSAYAGLYLFPPGHNPESDAPMNIAGAPVEELAAYKWNGAEFVEIPLQVDEKYVYFLANNRSDFGIYSGADMELTYAWDTKSWNPGNDPSGCNADLGQGAPDPIAGLDNDDEIAFMAGDAGSLASPGVTPPLASATQIVSLTDLLNPGATRAVYLVRQPGGTSFDGAHYVNYARNANASQWIDRGFFAQDDPEKLGSSNTGYGPNLQGSVCPDGTPATLRASNDRFTRDGTVVSTDTYRWEASGRWMIRDIRVKQPGVNDPDAVYWQARPDLVDRWKGRAFQQSPDSTISLVGFEDEQVNWEANSILLGERCGPVRCMREVWGADSGTNVTKTETFYRDAVSYRYHVRVHPIPPDGLYTSWDYNRGAMVSDDPAVPGGRYYTMLRPQGVPVDGINDDIGQVDGVAPLDGQCFTPDGAQDGEPFFAVGDSPRCPAFFDTADPTFNLTLAFDNWEQVSGKGDAGSLVYTFKNNAPTSLGNPLVVPYYRDDACLDDGTGDDPVRRPFPGESYAWNGGLVPQAYDAAAGRALDHSGATFNDCIARQGAHAAHGVHYFVTHDSDNAFVGLPTTEIDGTQWQFMVPTPAPRNVAEPYANVVRVPLLPVVVPLP